MHDWEANKLLSGPQPLLAVPRLISSMSSSISFAQVRVVLSLCLCVLAVVAAVQLKNEIVQSFQRMDNDRNEYQRSPGCVPTASDVDPKLTPCREVPAKVVEKSRHVERFYSKNYGWVTVNHNWMTLQDAYQKNRKVYEIENEFWDAVPIGDTVSVQVWKRGRITSLEGRGKSSEVQERGDKPSKSILRIQLWAFAFFGSIIFLTILHSIPTSDPNYRHF